MKRLKTDKGASSVIEFLFVILFLFVFLMTVLDIGLFFRNQNVMSRAAQNGANVVAVFGGNDPNSISIKYGGSSLSGSCGSQAECDIYNELISQKNTVNAEVLSISCGPGKTTYVGERVYCEIRWVYKGLPGSGGGLLVGHINTTRMTAETEVVHR